MYIRHHVDIVMEASEFVHMKGMPYDITIHFVNHTIFPIPMIKLVLEFRNCFASDFKSETLVTSLDAKGAISLTMSASSEYCGMCEYRIKKIRLYDYLSLFMFRKKSNQNIKIAILPNVNVIDDPLIVANSSVLIDSELFSSTKSGDDPSELYGIRPYELGDKMNRIHWKLSIKQDELMIKQFGLPINCAVAIMADFYTESQLITLAQIDGLVETFLTLSLSLVYQQQIHYMIWYDQIRDKCERFRVEKEEDCYEVTSLMYRCQVTGMMNDLLTYHEAQYPKEQYTNIFYITTDLSEDLVNRLNDQRKSAITHIFHLLDESSEPTEVDQYSESMGLKTQILRPSHISEDLACE